MERDSGLRPETERLLAAPPGWAKCIVVLGDSIVYGWGNAYRESYPALVESWLHNGAEAQEGWHVVNAGVPGDTVLHGALRYAQHVRPFRPRIVLLAFGLNDGALRRTRYDAQREWLWLAQQRIWARGVLIAQRLHRALQRRRPSLVDEPVTHQARPRVRERLFRLALRELARQVRRDGAMPHLVRLTPIVPQCLGEEQAAVYRRYDTLIQRLAAEEGLPCIPMQPPPDDPFVPERMSWPDGIHLTAAGQAWVARRVYRHLRETLPRDEERDGSAS